MSEPLSMEVRVESAAVESVRSGSATADPGGSFVELDFEAPRGLASPHVQSVLSSSAPRRLLVGRRPFSQGVKQQAPNCAARFFGREIAYV